MFAKGKLFEYSLVFKYLNCIINVIADSSTITREGWAVKHVMMDDHTQVRALN